MESDSTLEEAQEFIDNESITMNDVLDKNKRELVLIAQRLNIPMIASTTKDQLVPLINNKLFVTPLPEVPKTESQLQLELAKVEAEAKARVEIEVRKAEVEAQAQSQAQVQIRQVELDHEFRMCDSARPSNNYNTFDAGRNIRLVHTFNESDVNKYFQLFEKVANGFN
ncbi:hypothetical protein Pcinc_003205 [Petrolisthes cinctipes]|uniref:Uncharacterized protein n=1 Tax=Petrolisthes cinctipes TaxID=88211 RepID=A0AAE1GJI7_PETCI|nr:hypothetical protein Pcinc_003205 [Petrolisthes cinctipes]